MEAILTFTTAAAAAWLGVYGVRRWAARRELLDRPNERSMHAAPVPTGGGLAIAAVCLLGLLVHVVRGRCDLPATVVFVFACGAISIAVVSWIDDLRRLGVGVRFLTQSLAAAAMVWACSGWLLPEWGMMGKMLIVPAAFVWLVGMINAYNFMDGVDGMAAGTGVAAGLGWFALAAICGCETVGMMGLLLAAASGGFLCHNRPPARIFMGDVGSAFLGFSFGSLALMAALTDQRLAIAGAIVVWPFIFDTLTTFMRRLAGGENVLTPHRRHLFQRLCLAGWSHGAVSLFYAALAAAGSFLAAGMLFYPIPGRLAAAVALPLMAAALWTFVQFQTTAWAEEKTYPQEWPKEIEPVPTNTWHVQIRPDGDAIQQYPVHAGEQIKGG